MTTATPSALQRGKRMPNWVIKDHRGEKHAVWDYRQKTHILIIYEPKAAKETMNRWVAAIEADRKQWDWLSVKILIADQAPKDVQPGAYAIDRYGMLISSFPAGQWKFDDLERDFLYYEARHC